MDEHINRHTPTYDQSEDKPQSEQTYLRDVEKHNTNIEEKIPSCDDCGQMFENIPDLARHMNKGNNKITELRTILQRESQNS